MPCDVLLQYVNEAHEDAIGYTCSELMGKNLWELTKSSKNKPAVLQQMTNHLTQDQVSQSTVW